MRLQIVALVAALSASAVAQETPEVPPQLETAQPQPNAAGTGSQSFADPSMLFSGTPGAFLGLAVHGIQGEGLYASTIINTEFSLGPVGVGLALPLNLLVWNDDSCCGADTTRDSKTYYSVIRKRDWDELQDWFKLVRFIRFGHKREPVYVVAGQLWGATIGHGTLVNRYANNLNLDQTKFGLAFDVNLEYGGFETMADSLVNPALLAARLYLRPFGGTPILDRWAVGVTGVTDRSAPRSIDPTVQNPDGTPVVTLADSVWAGGVDTEFEILRDSVISVIPYVDLNRIAGAGNGIHAGILADLNLPIPVLELNVQARLEYRAMQAGYIPEYFDQTYDLGRVQYAVDNTTYAPKYVAAVDARQAAADPTAFNRRGYYGELALGFAGLVQVGGLYEAIDNDPNGASLGLFATLPKFTLMKVSAYYLRKNMQAGFGDAFTLDERSLLAASLAYKIAGPVYLRIDFQRRWVLQPGATRITAVDDIQSGIATFLTF
jgi:hypothetical protein